MKKTINLVICITFLLIISLYAISTKSQQKTVQAKNNDINIMQQNTPKPDVIYTNKYPETLTYGYIYIGDSRTVGLNNICHLSDEENTYVIAKVGEGHNYLKDYVFPKIDKIINSNSDITDWIIISNFGVNDLNNIEKYKQDYQELKCLFDCTLLIVSVNPIEYHTSITNDMIKDFNEQVKTSGDIYIDCYAELMNNGYLTTDGIHYTNETYSKINDYIKQNICEIFKLY